MNNKIARVLITKKCQRNCTYCCNQYTTIMDNAQTINDLKVLKDYNTICITGGEPMLNPLRTRKIIQKLRNQKLSITIYLYTAKYVPEIETILPLVQGVHFTLHSNSSEQDINDFQKFQQLIKNYYNGKSYRLYISPDIFYTISIQPNLWKRVEIKPWIPEGKCPLPTGETLFILNEKAPALP